MLWRFIVLGVLLVIVYFMVKSALQGLFGKGRDVTRSVGSSGRPSEMVQDPVCGMFIPKEGKKLNLPRQLSKETDVGVSQQPDE